MSAPSDALRPQRADLVEVFSPANAPDRPFTKYVKLETKSSGVASKDAADLRQQGGDTGCDAILLRAKAGQADCILYNGGKPQSVDPEGQTPSIEAADPTRPTEAG
jgi:hypothetical protein